MNKVCLLIGVSGGILTFFLFVSIETEVVIELSNEDVSVIYSVLYDKAAQELIKYVTNIRTQPHVGNVNHILTRMGTR